MNGRGAILIFLVLMGVVLGAGCYFGYQTLEAERAFGETKTEMAELLNYKDRALNINSWLFPDSEWGPKKVVADELRGEAQAHRDKAVHAGNWMLGISALGVILCFLIYRGSSGNLFRGVGVLLIATMCLGYGVTVPMMELEVFEDDLTAQVDLSGLREAIVNYDPDVDGSFLDVIGIGDAIDRIWTDFKDFIASLLHDEERVIEGRTYFKYENKSVFGVLGILWDTGNYFVCVAIFLFSFLIPLLKISVSLILLTSRRFDGKRKLTKFIGYIGKFSMADVFVVAMFLAYLSFYNMNADIPTEAHPLVGIYFFSAYVLLSIFSYFLVERAVRSADS